jgi:hypothetical protein
MVQWCEHEIFPTGTLLNAWSPAGSAICSLPIGSESLGGVPLKTTPGSRALPHSLLHFSYDVKNSTIYYGHHDVLLKHKRPSDHGLNPLKL